MEWYEQHPPKLIEPVSINDYLEYCDLNLEPSSFDILWMNDANAAVNNVLDGSKNFKAISNIASKPLKRKEMRVAGLNKLQGSAENKAVNED